MTDNYEDNSEYGERYGLAYGRIKLINSETAGSGSPLPKELSAYFHKTSAFIMETCGAYNLANSGMLDKMDITGLKKLNQSLYEDINGSSYIHSYAEPDFAAGELGKDIGTLLCVLYTEMRTGIVYAFEKRLSFLVPLLELYIQVYNILEDNPSADTEIHDAIYYYFFDYADIMAAARIRSLLDPGISFATDIIMQKNLSEPSYLYLFGEYISENELKTSEYLSTLPESSIKDMASTFTEGYRKGFEAYNIDLSKKGTVNIRYVLGFERIVREAVRQFGEMGLKPCIYRAERGLIYRSSGHKNGYYGGNANRQYDYDHRMDECIIFDKAFADRRLSAQRKAFEDMKELASLYAGPAVMETFGETDFTAVDKKTAPRFNEKQQEQRTNFMAASSLLTNEFIPGDTTSFTIIAYPVPSVGSNYQEIFKETIKVNTLDPSLYGKIQTCLINALDEGDFVTITGRSGNITNINVALAHINNPAEETKFENCLADVNIPLGEVFTSPQLKGTDGLLHATSIYLDGLIYKDLKLEFKDGVITSYS